MRAILIVCFLAGEKPTFIHENIRKRIKEDDAAERKPEPADLKRTK